MNIPMPTPEEKNKSIDFIMKTAYKPTFSKQLFRSIKSLGFRNLWVGVEWCVIVPTIFTLLYLLGLPDYIHKIEHTPPEIFFVAPLFYGSLLFLTLWKEWEDQVYPLKQTCFFSTSQLTSLRCLCFGGLSAFFQGITMLLVLFSGAVVTFSSFLLSLSFLVFYGGMSFLTLRKTETVWAHGFTLGLWFILTMYLRLLNQQKEDLSQLLLPLGSGALLFLLLPCTLFMGTQLKKYYLKGELSCYPSKM